MSVFDRATKVVADLDSPFYAEERQRDVWNEASAVGFQTMLWGALVLSCAMVWAGGAPLVPWALALLVLLTVASLATTTHANRRGVSGLEDSRVLRPRTVLVMALLLATAAGIVVRADPDLSASSVAGAVVGAAAGIGIAIVSLRRRR